MVDGGIHQAGDRQIGQKHAEGDRQQEQGLEFFDDCQVDQDTGNDNHDHMTQIQCSESGIVPELAQGFDQHLAASINGS